MNEELNPNIDNFSNEDKEFENVLRPKLFNDFKGQNNIVENLKVFIEAAKKRNESLDHVLPVSYTHLTLPTIYSV